MNGSPEIMIVDDPEAVAVAAVPIVLEIVDRALAATGRCDIALAGGTTPVLLYDALTAARADWSGVHLWTGDERAVPHDDPESNVRLIRTHLPAPGAVLHAPPGSGEVDRRAMAYGFQLKDRVLDLAILGLGEDAHTASLFPGDPALDQDGPVVFTRTAPKPPSERVSFSMRVLRGAQRRLLLVTGEGKRAALRRTLGEPSPSAPASLLPGTGTTIVADRSAHG